jgi:DNA invertase Pin-like site-specific DNA recombinase
VRHARQLYDQGETVSEIAKVLKVSRATVYRHLEESRKGETEDS